MLESSLPSMREIAIHEAGHAVMARAVGAFVTHIELVPDENSFARYYAGSRITLPQPHWAAVAYAGFVAQRRVNPKCSLHGADADNFETCLRGAGHGARKAIIARTEATIAAHWDEVERLATELERCNGLYTKELETLGYWWPAPMRGHPALSRALAGR
jgi:hypothetical protein